MQLRHTIIFIPNGQTEVVTIRIFTSESINAGLWNVDNNEVLLSPELYNHFKSLRHQAEQKKFFDQLKKVSLSILPMQLTIHFSPLTTVLFPPAFSTHICLSESGNNYA